MAARHWSKEIRDLTECPICTETFTDPKVLWCGHTFCLKCHIQSGGGNNPGEQAACPFCRNIFLIPLGGLKNLPTNFVLNDLLSVKQSQEISRRTLQAQPCDLCPRDEIDANAENFCIECTLHLCAMCTIRHRMPMATKSHQIVSLAYKQISDDLRRQEENYDKLPNSEEAAEHQQGISKAASAKQHQQGRGLSADEFVTKAEVLRDIKCGKKYVWGIAQLGTELFVCTTGSERVVVYDVNTYRETRHVTVASLKQPSGIAACKKNNCLYISDYGPKCIRRVDLSNQSRRTLLSRRSTKTEYLCRKWSVNADPRGVSLTRAFNLLVTLTQSIKEYTTNGSLIRAIKLDVSIDNSLHCIELSSSQFVVCHVGSTQDRVCVVDTAGRIVHSYGGPPGSSAGQLDCPCSLAVDSRGYVFVADLCNNRVEVLSPTPTRLGDVTTPGHQLIGPMALHLDGNNGRLYVGYQPTSMLVIYVNCV